MLPGKFLKFFTPSSSLISGFLSHSDRILASVQLGIFFLFKIYLFMTDFRKKLETGVDPRLSSTVVS